MLSRHRTKDLALAALAIALSTAAWADQSGDVTVTANTYLNLDTGTSSSVGGDILWNGTALAPQGGAALYNLGKYGSRVFKAIGIDKVMWGSDYPHDEGTYPYTREHLRQLFHDTEPGLLQQVLAENTAALYDFDLAQLAPLAAKFGPTVDELHQPLDRLPDEPNEALLRVANGER